MSALLSVTLLILAVQQISPATELPQSEAKRILTVMAAHGTRFDPKELHSLGVPGLSGILDQLLPDTAIPSDRKHDKEVVKNLINQLGDQRFQTREQATSKLIAIGNSIRSQIMEATKSADPEVRRRAETILRALEPPALDERVVAAFRAYLQSIKDSERLEIVARRLALAFSGKAAKEDRLNLLQTYLITIAKSSDDRHFDPLIPLLDHQDNRVSVMIVKTVGSSKSYTFFPRLLLEALKSKREEVVEQAILWTPNCWDKARAPEVRQVLRRVFESGSERLKFHACFPLMNGYRDPDAFRYLLEQTQSTDLERARIAIHWVGDACNTNRPITDEILEKLTPFLESKNTELRRAAAWALGTYAGEKVVKLLIPRLGDEQAIIVQETCHKLPFQRDKEMLRRLLQEAADRNENPRIRAKAKELLGKIPEK